MAQAYPALGDAMINFDWREALKPLFYFLVAICLALIFVHFIGMAVAHDYGQWDNQDPAIRAWYQRLMQPDNPSVSCCGEADGYWADQVEVKGDKVFAIITDDRPDGPLGRPHVPMGTKVEIPPRKYMHAGGNPTGHAVIFLSLGGEVYCYVVGTLS